MNKDIIYIDTEDDITAVIGKIKDSKEKIIALVPPKRTGVLQSAVNLRLLARMADKNDRKLVIITNNKSLSALSAAAKIPVAKNLQSKPEMAEIAALEIDDGEDIIDGKKLPVGELVKTVDSTRTEQQNNQNDPSEEDIELINVDQDIPLSATRTEQSAKSKIKVPDFNKFRKKLFIGIILGFGLIGFLVWAIVFAPSAKVIITAKTEDAPVSMTLKLGGTAATDTSKSIVQSLTKTVTQDVSVEFTATGTKEIGEKAKGTLTVYNGGDTGEDVTLPAGSVFYYGDFQFTTDKSVYVAGSKVVSGQSVPGSNTVAVTASEVGADYNLSAGDYYSNISKITATGTAMAGGSSHTATVVSAEDIAKATAALEKVSSDSVKKSLTKQFENAELVIGDSFNANRATPVSVPAVDQELVSGKAKLTSSVTFSISAIAKSEVKAFLKSAITKQISNSKTMRIYSDGVDDIKFSGFVKSDDMSTINMSTTGQIGPNIDEASIKNQIKGKVFGDVQSLLEDIEGVDSVDVKFSYFWVTKVPNDIDKIDIEFNVQNG